MLHIVKHSPFTSDTLSLCLASLNHTDGILLIEDGTYGLKQLDSILAALTSTNKLYILQDDAQARGLTTDHNDLNWVDFPAFVQLTLDYPKTLSW